MSKISKPTIYSKSCNKLKILEKIDSECNSGSVKNQVKKTNCERLQEAMNGLPSFENLCYLQVTGRSQLQKEIHEISKIQQKVLQQHAIHRNEVTKEIEGFYNQHKDPSYSRKESVIHSLKTKLKSHSKSPSRQI